MNYTPVALLSAFDKTGLAPFATSLRTMGFELIASWGTKRYLEDFGIACGDIADIVGPPILGNRVVTLSREIFAGLLAQDTPSDREELKRLNMRWIDLVYVDLYPLRRAIEAAKGDMDTVRSMNDIGGPALLRAAAKGGRIAVSCRDDFERALQLAQCLVESKDMKLPERQRMLASIAYGAEMTVMNYCQMSMAAYAKFYRLGTSLD